MTLYSLIEKKDTEELHIFCSKKDGKDCLVESASICGKMKFGDKKKDIFACITEEEMRKKCAEIGRKVCGNCVITLYTTY